MDVQILIDDSELYGLSLDDLLLAIRIILCAVLERVDVCGFHDVVNHDLLIITLSFCIQLKVVDVSRFCRLTFTIY